jgi:hypothetical protein
MKIMEKKNYIAPEIRNVVCESVDMIASSILDQSKSTQSITVSTEEEADEFTSRRFDSWMDEE